MFGQNKKIAISYSLGLLFSIFLGFGIFVFHHHNSPPISGQNNFSSRDDLYTSKVQKVFNNRCVACHGCYEAPCQLNLQSYDGLVRGVHPDLVYEGTRLENTTPTRMDFDGNQITWNKLGFHPVIGNAQQSVLLNSLDLTHQERPMIDTYPNGRQCINQNTSNLNARMKNSTLGMPYNFTSITPNEIQGVREWIQQGAPPPPPVDIVERDSEKAELIKQWNTFLNTNDYKHKLTSRYLFEHLYLAHLYFSDKPRQFYRLIRSKTDCDAPEMIYSRRANSHPGVEKFYYCIVKYPPTVVSKNHLPYNIDLKKLNRVDQLFIQTKWPIEEDKLPSYDATVAADPFHTFNNIPQESRYRYLLEDAQYHVMTFIKGPVCNGSMAVNAIQDRFYVFFMDPVWDSKINTQEFLLLHKLPGEFDKISLHQIPSAYLKIIQRRKDTRHVVNRTLEKKAPQGLPIEAIWNGDGFNDNAALTILRHDDNAAVFKGAVGDITKTVFVLDYSTFERLVYNLVVNFDVYGNLGHQLLTRIYMNLIRLDSEDTYLNYLPLENRKKYKAAWYSDRASKENWTDIVKGLGMTEQKIAKKVGQLTAGVLNMLPDTDWAPFQQKYLYSNDNFPNIPAGISFQTEPHANVHLELVKKILFERLGKNIVKQEDSLNWNNIKTLNPPDAMDAKLVDLSKAKIQNYSRYFPEVSFIVIGKSETPSAQDYIRFYSVAHNREFNSIGWLFNENWRRFPEDDSLTISRKVLGSHPNQFFYVSEAKLDDFVKNMKTISSNKDYQQFVKTYGISRMHANVWHIYDFINEEFLKLEGEHAGYLDLFRYSY